MMADGFHDLPPGKLATVVTHLEMRAPFDLGPAPLPTGVDLLPLPRDVETYLALYRRVGAEWLWTDRLAMPAEKLRAILADPAVEICALEKDGQTEGLLELDFRKDAACEIAYFGLSRALIGTGAGRALMREAITRAWARPIARLWVHTCTLDSPQALGFYRKCGFVPFKQQVEVFTDPRLRGFHGADDGPHVPCFAA